MRGFVSFESDLLSGGGGSKGLLSAKILLLCAEVYCVLFLAVYRRQKAHHYNGVKVENRKGLNFKSIVVFGRIKISEDKEKNIDICKKLSEKFNFGSEYIKDELKKFADVVTVLELTPEHITCKLVNES
ncbi:MAG: hypothetical protein ACI37T_00430 [Candidatus Gastranaerophilaceae bacterium]